MAHVLHYLAPFPFKGLCNALGYWAQYLYALPSFGRSVIRSCPWRSVLDYFFAPPSSPLQRKLLYLRMLHFFAYAEIIFTPYLSISACAIEVQHVNENFATIRTPANIFVRGPLLPVCKSVTLRFLFLQSWSKVLGHFLKNTTNSRIPPPPSMQFWFEGTFTPRIIAGAFNIA